MLHCWCQVAFTSMLLKNSLPSCPMQRLDLIQHAFSCTCNACQHVDFQSFAT